MSKIRSILAWIALSCVLFVTGCGEVKTFARLERGPTFLLSGSGKLASFRIYGPKPGRVIATPNDAKSLVWSVQASAGYFEGLPVQGLKISSGSVPSGYLQTIPEAGTTARLKSRLVYYFVAETTNAPGAEGFFYLVDDLPTLIVVPELCQSSFVGDVQPLNCETGQPYVEPVNLEQFVRENRVSQ
jgi:hypothetical protein